jgi:hypothetical protein
MHGVQLATSSFNWLVSFCQNWEVASFSTPELKEIVEYLQVFDNHFHRYRLACNVLLQSN